jgi:hypothetical protein
MTTTNDEADCTELMNPRHPEFSGRVNDRHAAALRIGAPATRRVMRDSAAQ